MSTVVRNPLYDRNIRIFIILELANSAAFISGNWLFFWMRVMTYGQLGVVDALSFAFGMLMEIPTGAIADLVGKKWSMCLAMISLALGFLIMGFSDTLAVLIVGFWFAQIGWAFYSGAAEALAYDSAQANGREGEFDRIYSRIGVYGMAMFMFSSLSGGVLYHLNERLPHLIWGLCFGIAAIASLWITEPPIENPTHFSLKGYVNQLTQGFKQLRQASLRPYIPTIFAVRGASYMYGFGLIQPTMAIGFGFLADAQAVLNTVLQLAIGLGSAVVPRLRQRMRDENALAITGGIMGLGYLSGFLPLGWLGFFGMVAIRFAGGISVPLSSVILNREIPSDSRATTLSTVAFFVRLPYVVTAIIAGSMAENGQFALFMLVCAVIILGITALARWLLPIPATDTIQPEAPAL